MGSWETCYRNGIPLRKSVRLASFVISPFQMQTKEIMSPLSKFLGDSSPIRAALLQEPLYQQVGTLFGRTVYSKWTGGALCRMYLVGLPDKRHLCSSLPWGKACKQYIGRQFLRTPQCLRTTWNYPQATAENLV